MNIERKQLKHLKNKLLTIMLIMILSLFLNSNVYALTPSSSGTNINNNVFNYWNMTYKSIRYKLYNKSTNYNGNMASTITGRMSGLSFAIRDLNLVGYGVYRIELHTTTTDYTTNLTSAPILICQIDNFGLYNLDNCFDAYNKVMGGASSSSGKRSRFQFDFTLTGYESLTDVPIDLGIIIGSKYWNNQDYTPVLDGTTQYSGVDNFRIDNINMYQVALPGVVVPDDSTMDDLNTTIQNEGAKTQSAIRTGNNILTNIWNTITGFFSNFWTNISTTFSQMLRPLIDGLGGLANWLSDIYDTIFSGIQNWLENIWRAIIGIIGSISDIQDWLVDTLSPILLDIFQFLKDAIVNFIASFVTFIHYINNLPSPMPYLLKLMIWSSLGFAIWRLLK